MGGGGGAQLICDGRTNIVYQLHPADPSLMLKIVVGQDTVNQGLSQDLETGCIKLAITIFLGLRFSKGGHYILRLQP